jgi:hypothetical protein
MLRAARSLASVAAALLGGLVAAAVPCSALAAAARTAAASPSAAATITGAVRAPADHDPALAVHAWSAATGKRYSTTTAPGQRTYWLAVPPGRYVVFAVPADPGAPPLYAGHTRFTLCARDVARLRAGECQDHALVEIEVAKKRVEGVDVTDWFLDGPTVADLARALDRPGDSWTEAELAAPKFREYPVAKVAAVRIGEPAETGAPPVLTSIDAAEPRFERDRAALEAALAASPNFAGRFALVRVPCAEGAAEGCSGAALLDVANGRVSYPPALNPLPAAEACLDRGVLQFRSDSRLLTLSGRDGDALVTRYFVLNPDAQSLRIVASLASEFAERCAKPAPQ